MDTPSCCQRKGRQKGLYITLDAILSFFSSSADAKMNRIAAALETRRINKADEGIASLLRGRHEETNKEAQHFVESYIKIERRLLSSNGMHGDVALLRSEGVLVVITKTLASLGEQNGRYMAKNM
ncbi:MAG: hypothetical protein M1611_01255, partial [Candidatus Marsarchaeota archaeon]|nr:hypothetical protein [Candidatus Marsarchaeota archaeon]